MRLHLRPDARAKLPFFVDSGEACASCGGLDDAEGNQMLLCDAPGGCDVAYHQKCLTPALESVPEGDWLCPMHDPASSSYGKKAAAKSKSPAKEGPGGTRLGIDDCGSRDSGLRAQGSRCFTGWALLVHALMAPSPTPSWV